MKLKVAIQMDHVSTIDIDGDSTFVLGLEAERRGYEVWHYTTGKNRYYVFVDQAGGLGNYRLITSNDVREQTLPNWQELLHKAEAIADISRFLGMELDAGVGGQFDR